jgi:hypothetical protein
MKIATMIAGAVALASQVAAAAPLCDRSAQGTFTETFEGRGNEGGWTLSGWPDLSHGDTARGSYLRAHGLVTFAPMGMTAPSVSSRFTGDYRAQNVVAVGADFKIFGAEYTTRERPMSLVLISDPGTPDVPDDDIYVSYVGRRNIPTPVGAVNGGWTTYQFEIPTFSPTLPFPRSSGEWDQGWRVAQGSLFTPAADPDAAWNMAIEDVDQVIFWFHDPMLFAILQGWSVAMDNATVVTCTP